MGLRPESKQDEAEEGVTGGFQVEATVCLYEGPEVSGVLVMMLGGLNEALQFSSV